MDASTKRSLTIVALVVVSLLAGLFIYNRLRPSPEAQRINDSAAELEKKLEEINKAK